MLFHSMKQSLIILSTGYILPSLFTNEKVEHLYFDWHRVNQILRFNYFYDSKYVSDMVALKLPEREFEGLLNFVPELRYIKDWVI